MFRRLKKLSSARLFLCCLTASAAFLCFCSKCSFLYPLNDWVDVNIYFTIGKGMFRGLLPYRDLYDQKGPAVFFLYGIASCLDGSSMIGVYVLECLSFAGFLFFSCRTYQLFERRGVLLAVPLLSMLILPSLCFSHGGSLEEFCLLPYAVTLYHALRFYRRDYPRLGPSARVLLADGILAGTLLFSKFTLLGFYLGYMAVIVIGEWSRKRFAGGLRSAAVFLSGMLLASLPWILYFLANGAIGDLMHYYFYNNIFGYSYIDPPVLPNTLIAILRGTAAGMWRNLQFSILIIFGFIWLTFSRENPVGTAGKVSLWSMAVLTAASVYCGGQGFRYYAIVLAVFAVLGLPPLVRFLLDRISPPAALVRFAPAVLAAAGIGVCLLFSDNTYLLGMPPLDTPQYRFAARMREESEDVPVSLINYGFPDSGFYLAANVLPPCRFFTTTNLPMPEVAEEQRAVVRDGKAAFAVTRDRTQPPSEDYVLIDTASLYYEEEISTYRLYRYAG